MFYTIYKTTNIINHKYYIGKHKTKNINDSYLGSGIALNRAIKRYGKDAFQKQILFVFDTELEMVQKEKEIVTEDVINDPLCYNIGKGGQGGELNNKGTLTSFDLTQQKFRKVTIDEFRNNPNLKGGTYGQITVKDQAGKTFNVSKDDPRYLSGELLHISTGRQHSQETLDKIRSRRKEQCSHYNPHTGRINIYHPDYGFKKVYKAEFESYSQLGWIKRHPSKGTIVLHRDGRNTRAIPEQLEQMLREGWTLGGRSPTKKGKG